jgi:hypothetical protein
MGKDGEKPEKTKKTNKIDWNDPIARSAYKKNLKEIKEIEKLTGTSEPSNYGKKGIAAMTHEERKAYRNASYHNNKYKNRDPNNEPLRPHTSGVNVKSMSKSEWSAYKRKKETEKFVRDFGLATKLGEESNQYPLDEAVATELDTREEHENMDFLFDPEFINDLDQTPDPDPNKGGRKTRRKRVKKTKRKKQRIIKRKSFKR